jgi:transcriptional regulator of acetoin/glycerol metabolism
MDGLFSNGNDSFHQNECQTDSSEREMDDPEGLDWTRLYHGEFVLSKTISPEDILKSWRRFSRATYREWQRFINGANDIDTSIIHPEILESWLFCRSKKLDPLGQAQNPILTGEDQKRLFEDNALFIRTSRPFLDRLYQSIKTTSFVLALFDRKGYLLHIMQDDKFTDLSRQNRWCPGALWTEEYGGNNSVGSVIKLKKPLQILGPQHYLKLCHPITASAAPIFDPDGRLMGGITILAILYGTHPHTLGMAVASAHAIENEMKTQLALAQRNAACDETDVMAGLQQAIATYIPDALIAINNEGRLCAINETATKIFGFHKKEDIGRRLCVTAAGKENPLLLKIVDTRQSVTDMEIRLKTVQGEADFSLSCQSVTSPTGAIIGQILLASEVKRLKSLVAKMIGGAANLQFHDIHTQNIAFKKIIHQAMMVSKSSSTVLLLGESGTGKDIFAQAIHNASSRRNGPYIAINCAAIPRDLIAAELFGHEEGAFTGSRRGGNQGKFELADGGTIFLDEIAEAPLEIQAILLRVIEDKRVVRIGGRQIRDVDVRVLAATNRDLEEEVNKGNFRKDLYYRLNVFNLHLPPLRDRTDDIPLLVNIFVKKYANAMGKTICGIDQKVWDAFLEYAWPGNVRELQNMVERMVNYASGDRLTADLIPAELLGIRHVCRQSIDLESPEETEKRLIRHLLALNFKKKAIAEKLGVSRATLYRKLIKYRLLHKPDTDVSS